MNLRRLSVGVIALLLAGCSSEDSLPPMCYCDASLTFALPRPLAGALIQLSVQKPDGNVENLDCQPSGNVLACLPLSSALVPNFEASGALLSVTLEQADAGAYTVELRVDGTMMGGGTFNYSESTMHETKGGPCGPEGTTTTTCLMPQTFTIVP